jgi:hypothetical protein
MDQRVWLATLGVVTVQQPEIEKHQGVKSQAECVVMREAAQGKNGTDNPNNEKAENQEFSSLGRHLCSFLICTEY